MGKSFWQYNSLVTHMLFELQPIIIFSPVADFGDQSLCQKKPIIVKFIIQKLKSKHTSPKDIQTEQN
jgi:hypothetical protein